MRFFSYLAKVPDILSLYLHSVSVFGLFIVVHRVTSSFEKYSWLSFDWVLLTMLPLVLECLDIEASNVAAYKAHPEVIGSATFITLTAIGRALQVPTERAGRIIPVLETHPMECVTT